MAKVKCTKCKEEIQEGAKKCKHCGADQRSWFAQHKILTALLGLLALGVIGSAMSDSKSETTTSTVKETPSEEEESSDNEAVVEEKKYMSVITFSSSNNGQSDTFSLEGGKQKIVYSLTGSSSICTIYIMEEGKSLDVNGGFPELMLTNPESDETLVRKRGGEYYFDLNVANGECTVELLEER